MEKIVKNINIKTSSIIKAEKNTLYHIQDQNIKNIKVKKVNSNLEIIDENGSVTVIEDFYLESNVELLAEDLASSTTYAGITNTTAIGDTVALTEVAVEIALPSSTGAAVGATVFGPGALAAGAGGVALAAGGSGGNNGSLDAKQLDTPTVQLLADGGEQGDGLTNNAALQVSEAASDVTRTFSINGGAASTTYTAPTTDGDYTVVVTDTDTAGNTKTASITFTLDATLATPTVELANDTGSSSADKITNNAALTFSTAASDVTRSFKINDGAASTTYTAPITSGDYKVDVIDTDAAGNTKSASISFKLDVSLDTPTVQLLADGGEQGDGLTNNAALEVSEAASDVTRTFSINGGAASTTYTAPTTDGDYTVVVTDTDTAGNTKSASISFKLDVSLDTPTVQLLADGGEQGDGLTNNAALEVSEAASDVTRTFSINGGTATNTYTAPTTDGDYTVVVTDTDTAGNTKTASITFTLDATLATPTVELVDDTGSDDTDNITNNAALTFSTAASDVTRSFKINDGAASTTYTAPTTSGDYKVDVIDTDTAGNVRSASISFTLDVTIATPQFDPTKVNWSTVKLDGTDDFRPALSQGMAADVERFVVVYDQETFDPEDGDTIQSITPIAEFDQIPGGASYLFLFDRDVAGNTEISDLLPVLKAVANESMIGDFSDGIALGSNQVDTLTGSTDNEYIIGGLGNDTIIGNGGNDNLFGGDGNDVISHLASGTALLDGGAGDDVLISGFQATIFGGTGNDYIFLDGTIGSLLLKSADGGEGVDILEFDSEIVTMTSLMDKVKNMEILFYSGTETIEIDIDANALNKMLSVDGLNELVTSTTNTLKDTHKQVVLAGDTATYVWNQDWTKEAGTISMDLSVLGIDGEVSGLDVYTHNTLAVQFII